MCKTVDTDVSPSHVPPPRCDLINGTSDFSAAFEKCKAYQRGVIKGLPFVFTHFSYLDSLLLFKMIEHSVYG